MTPLLATAASTNARPTEKTPGPRVARASLPAANAESFAVASVPCFSNVHAGVLTRHHKASQPATIAQKDDLGGYSDRDLGEALLQAVNRCDSLVAEAHDQITLNHSRLGSWPSRLEGDNFDAGILVQIERSGDLPRQGHVAAVHSQIAAHDAAVLHELRYDPLGHVDRNGETDSLSRLNHRRIDADHPAAAIKQRTAAIARIQRRIGLDHVIDQMTGDAPERAAKRADHPRRHSRIEPEWTADRHHELADA